MLRVRYCIYTYYRISCFLLSLRRFFAHFFGNVILVKLTETKVSLGGIVADFRHGHGSSSSMGHILGRAVGQVFNNIGLHTTDQWIGRSTLGGLSRASLRSSSFGSFQTYSVSSLKWRWCRVIHLHHLTDIQNGPRTQRSVVTVVPSLSSGDSAAFGGVSSGTGMIIV